MSIPVPFAIRQCEHPNIVMSKDKLQEQMYEKGAAAYDQRIRRLLSYYDTIHAANNAILQCLLKPDSHLLVVGCGTGTEIVQLGKANRDWRFTGVDPALPMLDVARSKLEAEGLSERVSFFGGLLCELASGIRYDAATLSMVLHFLPDDGAKLALLKDVAAHLIDAAPLVLVDYHGDMATPESKLLLMAWQHQQHLGGASWEEVADWRNERFKALHLVPADRIRQLLSDTGFVRIQPFFQNLMLNGWLAFKDEER